MSTTTAVVGVTGTKNNGGVGINLGTSKVLKSSALGSAQPYTGSTVIDGTDTNKILSEGVFAYDNKKPIAKRITSSLATVTNTTLLSGALVPSQIRSINKIQSVVTNKFTTAIRAGYFNIYNGKFVDTNTGSAYTVPSATDTFNNDVAASPTRDNPGTLRYGIGSKVAVSASYQKKTS